jgi:hypothetical protein
MFGLAAVSCVWFVTLCGEITVVGEWKIQLKSVFLFFLFLYKIQIQFKSGCNVVGGWLAVWSYLLPDTNPNTFYTTTPKKDIHGHLSHSQWDIY